MTHPSPLLTFERILSASATLLASPHAVSLLAWAASRGEHWTAGEHWTTGVVIRGARRGDRGAGEVPLMINQCIIREGRGGRNGGERQEWWEMEVRGQGILHT